MAKISNDEKGFFTVEDLLTIDRILVGCSKLISSYSQRRLVPEHVKLLSRAQKKRLVGTFLLGYFATLVKGKQKFRQSGIRNSLPEEVRNISKSDLSRILSTLVDWNIIVPTKEDKRKRGFPNKQSRELYEIVGSKSLYEPSEYLMTLKKVVSKPQVKNLIHSMLFESNLLYRYLRRIALLLLYTEERKGIDSKDQEAAWRSAVAVHKKITLDMKELNKVGKKTGKRLQDKAAANQLARLFIDNHAPEFYADLYILGGMNFYA
jgi:hypothetical protein